MQPLALGTFDYGREGEPFSTVVFSGNIELQKHPSFLGVRGFVVPKACKDEV
jgi:hypothetical protein